jgi:hypothetical protein
MVEPLTVLIVILLAVVLLLASILVPSAEEALKTAICSLLGC